MKQPCRTCPSPHLCVSTGPICTLDWINGITNKQFYLIVGACAVIAAIGYLVFVS